MTSPAVAAVITGAELDKRYQPTRARTTICLDSSLVMEVQRLEERLADLQANGTSAADDVTGLADQVLQLRQQAKDSEHEFVFASIGKLARRDLMREHPPTKVQKAELKDGESLPYNPDTFPPALLAAACETVEADAEWWAEKLDTWGEGQVARLWQTCMAAQEGVNTTPKAAHAFAATRSRAESSE